jgi:hypothetical protein
VKVTFFKGASLKAGPTGGKAKDARWIDIHEGEPIDEALLTRWISQAAKLPGWGGR